MTDSDSHQFSSVWQKKWKHECGKKMESDALRRLTFKYGFAQTNLVCVCVRGHGIENSCPYPDPTKQSWK